MQTRGVSKSETTSCPWCENRNEDSEEFEPISDCPLCDGGGVVQLYQFNSGFLGVFAGGTATVECVFCAGTGETRSEFPCPMCTRGRISAPAARALQLVDCPHCGGPGSGGSPAGGWDCPVCRSIGLLDPEEAAAYDESSWWERWVPWPSLSRCLSDIESPQDCERYLHKSVFHNLFEWVRRR
jgi:hypothetical protein